jgi:hypothetical protein
MLLLQHPVVEETSRAIGTAIHLYDAHHSTVGIERLGEPARVADDFGG